MSASLPKRQRTAAEEVDLCCPITGEFFVDPVTTCTGSTYERWAITRWLLKNNTDPLTNQVVATRSLFPSKVVRSLVQERLGGAMPESWKDMVAEALKLPTPAPAANILCAAVHAGVPVGTKISFENYTGTIGHWAVRVKHTALMQLVRPHWQSCDVDSDGKTPEDIARQDFESLKKRIDEAKTEAMAAVSVATEMGNQLERWRAVVCD
jgi:hypothetical protein